MTEAISPVTVHARNSTDHKDMQVCVNNGIAKRADLHVSELHVHIYTQCLQRGSPPTVYSVRESFSKYNIHGRMHAKQPNEASENVGTQLQLLRDCAIVICV